MASLKNWLLRFLVVLPLLLIGYGSLFPSITFCGIRGDANQTLNDISSIVAAAKQYQIEYGHLPPVALDGLVLTSELNARLFRIFQGLEENPRKIVFFEAKTAKLKGGWFQKKKRCNGFDPVTGALLDSWGNPYRIAFDVSGTGQIASPYKGDLAIERPVIAWSVGEDGIQNLMRNSFNMRNDDVVSWE
ncbi:MAG: hypothetical protein V4710_21080 [Verrucomicrobiota bacterium]